jgi:SAM-dependent methyltransferase
MSVSKSDLNELEFLKELNQWSEGKPLSRVQNQVLSEYESGWAEWEEYLLGCKTLQEWLYRQDTDCEPNTRIAEQYYAEPQNTMTPKLRFIESVLNKYFPSAQRVGEAGCGIGRNIHYLSDRYPQKSFCGLELTTSGVKIANAASKKFHLNAQFQQFDMLSRQNVSQELLGSADVLFTCFALEQVSSNTEVAMERLLRITKQGLIHIEPVMELYPPTLGGTVSAKMHKRADYLKDFVATVCKLVQHRRVVIDYMGPAVFPIHAAHYPTLIVLRLPPGN